MQVDQKVVKKLIKGFNECKREIVGDFEEATKRISKCISVEEIMEVKKDLLLNLVNDLPIYGDVCYFCILLDTDGDDADCEKCQYGKIHGICDHDRSDWRKIIDGSQRFENIIDDYYHDIHDTFEEMKIEQPKDKVELLRDSNLVVEITKTDSPTSRQRKVAKELRERGYEVSFKYGYAKERD